MKIALITTTIYVPRVLALYRRLDAEVEFFVAGDLKTPHTEARSFVEGLGNAHYYSDEDQRKLGYACSEVIGWNKIMRRNIALLEAMRSGPDVIVSIDDDNIPLEASYFDDFRAVLGRPRNGLVARAESGWFNVGDFLSPSVYHRGFPYSLRHGDLGVRLEATLDTSVGVAAGLWLGDPDIDAAERITNRPTVRHLSDVLGSGVAVAPRTLTPFNSQNTAYARDLAPLMMVLVGVGRYDDIWASYIAQRVMMERDLCVHFGRPFVWQERNPQNQWRNLQDELFGMEHTERFCEDLLAADVRGADVLEDLRLVYEQLRRAEYLPEVVGQLGDAWCDDVERVLTR